MHKPQNRGSSPSRKLWKFVINGTLWYRGSIIYLLGVLVYSCYLSYIMIFYCIRIVCFGKCITLILESEDETGFKYQSCCQCLSGGCRC